MAIKIKLNNLEKVIKFTLLGEDSYELLKTKSVVKGESKSAESFDKYTFIASKEIVDRDKDIVRVAGIDTKTYKTNPVVLGMHDWRSYPIGKTVDIKKTPDTLFMDIKFAGTDEGLKAKQLVDERMLNAVSIGFVPKNRDSVYWNPVYIERFQKYGYNTEKMKTYEDLQKDDQAYYDSHKKLLLKADRVFYATNLMELSLVAIPANQEALYVAASKGLDSVIVKSFDGEYIKIGLPEVKAAIPYSAQPSDTVLDSTSAWNAPVATTALRKWASSDDSGDKNTIKWNKYKAGFTWLDSSNVSSFGSYKLPHHTIAGSKFTTVWRGVAAAMGSLLGSRGGVSIPEADRKPVYNHLKKHYKEFDKTAPAFKEYTLEEAVEVFDEDTLKSFLMNSSMDGIKEEIAGYKGIILDLQKQLSMLVKQIKGQAKKEVEIKEIPPSDKDVDKGKTEVDASVLDRKFIKDYVKQLTITTLKNV